MPRLVEGSPIQATIPTEGRRILSFPQERRLEASFIDSQQQPFNQNSHTSHIQKPFHYKSSIHDTTLYVKINFTKNDQASCVHNYNLYIVSVNIFFFFKLPQVINSTRIHPQLHSLSIPPSTLHSIRHISVYYLKQTTLHRVKNR